MMVQLECGTLDLDRRVVERGGKVLRLTPTEASLLDHLVRNPGRRWSRDELQVQAWGYRPNVLSRTVFTTVGRVRAKIERDPAAPRHLLTTDDGCYVFVPLPGQAGRVERQPARALPRLGTPFLGRARELAEVEGLLEAGERLVTLVGPGGMGKTRLALEVARRREPRHADGAAFVSLEEITLAAALPAAIAGAVGLSAGGGTDPLAEVLDALAGRDLLLVLDNAEQLPSLPEVVSLLVEEAPRVSVLVTSRIPLNLRRERAWPVPAMTLPGADDALAEVDAGRLLLAEAARVRPGWIPSPKEGEAMRRICHLVGGAPLALELAAAWLRVLEPADVAGRLTSSLDLLHTSLRDVPERHRSVRAALEGGLELLRETDRRALGPLSLFLSPFTPTDAESTFGVGPDILAALHDAAVLRRLEDGRLELHPLVRQLVREKEDPTRLAAAGEAHARVFLDRLAGQFTRFARGQQDDLAFRNNLAPWHADLMAAWHHAVARPDPAAMARSAGALWHYLETTRRYQELLTALEEGQAALRLLPPSPDRDQALGILIAQRSRAGLATPEEVTEAVELLEERGGQALALGLICAAIATYVSGRPIDALPLAERAVALARTLPDLFIQVFAITVLGCTHSAVGRYEVAEALLTEALGLGRWLGGHNACRPMVHLGENLLWKGDAAGALRVLEEALGMADATNDASFGTLALCRIGQAQVPLGQDPLPAFEEAIEHGLQAGLPLYWWARALAGFGLAWAAHPDPERQEVAGALLAYSLRAPLSPPERAEVEQALAAFDPALAARPSRRGQHATPEGLAEAVLKLVER